MVKYVMDWVLFDRRVVLLDYALVEFLTLDAARLLHVDFLNDYHVQGCLDPFQHLLVPPSLCSITFQVQDEVVLEMHDTKHYY